MCNPTLRLATEADLQAINDIHSHYVLNSTSTYLLEPLSLDQRQAWFTGRSKNHPVTVVEKNGVVVAWGALGPFRMLAGYNTTAENSIYVHLDHIRQGLGRLVLEDQIQRAQQLDLHCIVAVVDSTQNASLQLHRNYGFIEAGRMKQIARKFDLWRDVVFMQLTLDDSNV